MEEEIKYMLEQEKREIENKFKQLTWLAKKLDITDRDTLKDVLEFVELFNECNANGWLQIK